MHNNKSLGRESLLLTIILPIKDRSHPPFHAAMLSFPHGIAQEVAAQLHNKDSLQLIIDGLGQNPGKLREASNQLAGRGCPGVEIAPVEMVGYYQLQTGRGEASPEQGRNLVQLDTHGWRDCGCRYCHQEGRSPSGEEVSYKGG